MELRAVGELRERHPRLVDGGTVDRQTPDVRAFARGRGGVDGDRAAGPVIVAFLNKGLPRTRTSVTGIAG